MLGAIDETHDIVYAACTQNGYEILRHLLDAGVPVAEIMSLPPARAEEHHVSGYQSYADIAERHDVPIYYPDAYDLRTEADVAHFESLDADLLLVMGWQRLVPAAILDTFTRGALGVHGSAYGLPKGRGRSPMNWSIIENLDRFLHSVIKLDSGADDGDVVATRKFDITPHDDIRTLYYKNVVATQEILAETLAPILRGEYDFEPQAGEATHYPKRTPADGGICWEERTKCIYNLVRAVAAPYPGAYTAHDDERVFVWEAIPFSDDFVFDADPGTIVQVFGVTDDFVVKTADGSLLVREWEAEDGAFDPVRGRILRSFGEPDRVDVQAEGR